MSESGEKRNSEQPVARIVSALFQPALTGSYVLVLVSLFAASTAAEAAGWALATIVPSAGVPLAFIAWQMRRGSISDFGLVLRDQRPGPLVVALAGSAAALVLTIILNAPQMLVHALLVAVASGSVLTLITLRWKISFHAGSAAAGIVIIGWIMGAAALALVPVVLAVGWSRVALGRHDTAQVVAGGLVSAIVAQAVLLTVQW